jgi:hypothetical protein
VALAEGAKRALVRTFPAPALVWRFYRDLKRIPNLVRPRTFNEKILLGAFWPNRRETATVARRS